MTTEQSKALWRWVIRMTVYLAVSSAILFLIAGDWAWAGGWLYVALQIVNTVLTYCMLYLDRPNLLIRREAMGEGTPKWDKVLAPLMAFSTLIISLASAVGIRFTGVMPVPAWLLLVAFLCMTAGHILTIQSMRQNDYFEGSVRIQEEYGHKVITTGPYKLVRHPGYLGLLLYNALLPVVLTSAWGFAGVGFFLIVLFWRTAREDRFLWENLAGYDEFTRQTPWRLIPGIW
ncbi:MAG: isoprenylcysteine carboxylmethyltransferase family protein [Anaerolineaceae bacterium]|nr:isoprenylcysteine carboxylmethyltransferase family protein [Anaerolineaceae bacterium]